MTFPIAHFEKNFFIAFNGGKLLITDNEYIIKGLFVGSIRFPKGETIIIPAPDDFILRGFYFVHGKKRWKALFLPSTYEKVSCFLYQ